MIRIFMAALILAGAVTRVGAQSSPHDYGTSPSQTTTLHPWLSTTEPPARPWSSILVYSDKTYDLKEHIESEHACRESLCYVQWQVGCDEHQEKLKADKRKAELEEIERKKAELVYAQSHPCVIDVGSNMKKCPVSDIAADYYDKDTGKFLYNLTTNGVTIGTSFYGDPPRFIQVAACFQ